MSDSRRPQDKWRHGNGRPSPSGSPSAVRGTSRTSKLFLGALLLAALIGVVIGLLFYLRPAPKPIFLSIAVTEYTDRSFPVNAYAQQDGEALRKHFGADSVQAFQSQERDLILRELAQLEERSRSVDKGRPIVVHLSANAAVENGSVFVIPGNATAGSSATYIRLEELLKPLQRASGNRMLLLDLRPVVDARLGLLTDDLAERVQQALTALQQSNELSFPVIVSCGPGSTPLWSRELKRSAFGWFLDRGLSGHADGWNGSKDDRVNSQEYLAFAREHVFGFTNKLERSQLPATHGKNSDFVVIPVAQGGPPLSATPQAAGEYPQWLFAGWQERDRLRAEHVERRLPRTFRHYEVILLRAESQWLGGADQAKIQAEFENDERELRVAKNLFPEPMPPVRSLAWAEKMGSAKRDEAKLVLQPLLDAIKANPIPKKEDAAEFQKLRLALREKPPDAGQAAAVLFAAAVGRNELSIEQLKQLVVTLQSLPGTSRFAESALLRFITEVDAKRLRLWDPEAGTIPQILLTLQLAEQAIGVDGRALPWIADELRAADKLRREAMERLLTGESDARETARKQLDTVRTRYAAVLEAGKALDTAFAQLDETHIFLVQWNGFDAPDAKLQQELEALWGSIVGECRDLQPLLIPPKTARLPDAQQLQNKANDLRFRRERVLNLMKPPTNANPVDLSRWLAWPMWSAPERRQFVEQTSAAALQQVEKALQALVVKSPSVAIDQAARDKSALWRARQALDLLMLAESPDLTKPEDLYQKLKKNPSREGFEELGAMISRRWLDQLPESYRQTVDLSARTRMGWAIHPFDLPAIPRSGDSFPRDAAAESYRKQQKEFANWVGEFRDRSDAEMYRKLEGPGAQAYSNALEELAREQLNWKP